MRARATGWWGPLALVWIVSAVYVGQGLRRGWIPHDEGTLAESAERVLQGELPHRDFDEVYSGGLSYLNALAFRVFGTNLFSLRVPLFLVFLLWVPALYYVATRFARPAVAAWVVALGAAWSLPKYSAALPSWYNLFFATFGTAALLRYLEIGRSRWLFAGGVAGGLSCLAKITGLYYVAGVLLVLPLWERTLLQARPARPTGRFDAYAVTLGAALLCFVVLVLWLVHRRFAVAELVQYVLPVAAIAGFVFREAAPSDQPGRVRLASFFRVVGPFALGLSIPIAVSLIPYVLSGSVAALWNGVFVAPTRRLDFAARSLPGAPTLLAAVPVALLLGLIPLGRFPGRRLVQGTLLIALLTFLILSRHPEWYSLRPLLPLAVLVGVWWLTRDRERLPPVHRLRIALVLSVATLCSLVQFPWEGPVYFFYVGPLVAAAVLAVVALQDSAPTVTAGTVLGLYLLFAVINTHPPREPTAALALERGGGLIVPVRERDRYESLVELLRRHASGGYVYVGPDSPEVYFLAALRNPMRTIFEFLSDSAGQTQRVLQVLDDRQVTVVAVNRRPPFSRPLSPVLLDSLAARYPAQDSVERFVVRWRP